MHRLPPPCAQAVTLCAQAAAPCAQARAVRRARPCQHGAARARRRAGPPRRNLGGDLQGGVARELRAAGGRRGGAGGRGRARGARRHRRRPLRLGWGGGGGGAAVRRPRRRLQPYAPRLQSRASELQPCVLGAATPCVWTGLQPHASRRAVEEKLLRLEQTHAATLGELARWRAAATQGWDDPEPSPSLSLRPQPQPQASASA